VSGKVLCKTLQPAWNQWVAASFGLPRFETRPAQKPPFWGRATLVCESWPHRLLSVDEFPAGS
jgi:hypothetical protein